jgi:hypothetical protein
MTGRPEKKSQDCAGQDLQASIQGKTAKTGLPGHDCQDMAAGPGQSAAFAIIYVVLILAYVKILIFRIHFLKFLEKFQANLFLK